MSLRRRLAIAFFAGLALALGTPPLSFWFTAPFCIAAYVWATDGTTFRRSLLIGWSFGTAASLGAFHWIIGTVLRFSSLPMPLAVLTYVLLALVAGLTLGATSAMASLARTSITHPIALAASLLVAERFMPGIFPWQLASTLIEAPLLPQSADVLGVSGLGALLLATLGILTAPLIARLPESWRTSDAPPFSRRAMWIAASLLLVAFAYGGMQSVRVRSALASAPTMRVALVQPAIPPTVRWDTQDPMALLNLLIRTTNRALDQRPDLVVWSEAAFPFALPHRAGFDGLDAPPMHPLTGIAPMVVGAVTRDGEGHLFNSAFLRHSDGRLSAPVSKRVLVPFGEYVPLVNWIPFVRRAFARAQGVTPGSGDSLLVTERGTRLGVLNCFEDTLPWSAAVLPSPSLLVNITNDAWFGESAGPLQHLMLARWRAIETRRELVRSVNTGVTCHVDALGRIASQAPRSRTEVLLARARLLSMSVPSRFVIRALPWIGAVVLLVGWLLARRGRST